MTAPPPPSPAAPIDPAPGAPASVAADPLPVIETPLAAAEVVQRLDEAARRGKMPGFHHGSGPILFTVTDFGSPFESVLEARADAAPAGGAKATRLRFATRMKTRLAWVYAAVLIATIWPGVWITDSMLKTYFPGVNLYTWWWYLPLTVPFVPLGMWTAIRKSRDSGTAEAREIVERIRKIVASR